MKVLALFAILFSATACTSMPARPDTSCSVVGSCQNAEVRASLGLGVEHTVQTMAFEPMLIGGAPANAAEWPASVYAKAGSSACSATLVGERTLFMAAHCMGNNGTVSFTAGANQYKARCTHHPEYRKNSTADWALCLVDRPVTGVPFEVLGIEKTFAIGDNLLLSGYGCVKPGGGGGNDGIFRIGQAVVRGLPSGKNYDIVTKGGAALCYGDSGGSAYLLHPSGERSIVGVNSRGNIATMSYLPAVASKTFVSWAHEWAKTSNNVRLCGLHDDALGCRTGGAKPQPDGKFEVQGNVACVRGVIKPDYLSKKDEIVESVRKALE